MTFKILDWKLTVRLSFLSVLFSFAYFFWLTRNLTLAAKYSVSSLVSLGLAHGAHTGISHWLSRTPSMFRRRVTHTWRHVVCGLLDHRWYSCSPRCPIQFSGWRCARCHDSLLPEGLYFKSHP